MKHNSPKNKTTRREGGFTLLETTVASLVMMVGALAVSSLFVFATQNNVGGAERALAMAVAQQQLEQIRSVRYQDVSLTTGVTTAMVRNGERNYTVQKEVVDETNPADGTLKRLKRITITVTPEVAGANWLRTPVVLVSHRSTLTPGTFAVNN